VRGHNFIFSQFETDFFQLVNQDAFLELNYVEEMLKSFVDERVGSVNGKVLQYDWEQNTPNGKIDSTGLTYSRGGRGRSRGQHEVDNGQYDNQLEIIGVDGSACMYRRSALEAVKMLRPGGGFEYFDEDFDMYWEDVDVALRLLNAGYTARYAPTAVAYHGRTAGSTPGGYKKVWAFFKTHRRMNPLIRQWNYKNHQFVFIKNSPRWYWQFFAREFFYHMYLLGLEVFLFDFATIKVLPLYFKQLPLMFAKRKAIAQARKVSADQFTKLLS
jgi:GT2 family glycosyltransferase